MLLNETNISFVDDGDEKEEGCDCDCDCAKDECECDDCDCGDGEKSDDPDAVTSKMFGTAADDDYDDGAKNDL
jgi:hypothetical protein